MPILGKSATFFYSNDAQGASRRDGDNDADDDDDGGGDGGVKKFHPEKLHVPLPLSLSPSLSLLSLLWKSKISRLCRKEREEGRILSRLEI